MSPTTCRAFLATATSVSRGIVKPIALSRTRAMAEALASASPFHGHPDARIEIAPIAVTRQLRKRLESAPDAKSRARLALAYDETLTTHRLYEAASRAVGEYR